MSFGQVNERTVAMLSPRNFEGKIISFGNVGVYLIRYQYVPIVSRTISPARVVLISLQV